MKLESDIFPNGAQLKHQFHLASQFNSKKLGLKNTMFLHLVILEDNIKVKVLGRQLIASSITFKIYMGISN